MRLQKIKQKEEIQMKQVKKTIEACVWIIYIYLYIYVYIIYVYIYFQTRISHLTNKINNEFRTYMF